jgi:Tol biopolymer transport system component
LIHEPGDRGEGGLLALPFSLASLEPTGEAVSIAEDGQSASVAQDGTLVFLDGHAANVLGTLVWRNRAGELLGAIGQPQPIMEDPALSPDGKRIAVSSRESGDRDIWVYDLIRSTKTRVTFDDVADEAAPTWSPSGEDITYFNLGLRSSIRSKAADGTGEPVTLVESERVVYSSDWSRDGRYLVYHESINVNRGGDIRYREFGPGGEAGEPVTFLSTPAQESNPRLSPNGRFLAYVSDESGRTEIYVRPFPDGAGKWPVSVNGGASCAGEATARSCTTWKAEQQQR